MATPAKETTTRDGRLWQPSYLFAIDGKVCIGCGRCYKVCGRAVMTLKGLNEDGDLEQEENGLASAAIGYLSE